MLSCFSLIFYESMNIYWDLVNVIKEIIFSMLFELLKKCYIFVVHILFSGAVNLLNLSDRHSFISSSFLPEPILPHRQ